MPPIIKINAKKPDKDITSKISELISRGRTFVYPTETFYGIGALYDDDTAIKKIFDIKGRDLNNPLPLLIPGISFLQKIASDIDPNAIKIARYFWPGSLTLVFKAAKSINNTLTAGTGNVACRFSGSKILNRILKNINSSITTTSANISGEKSASKIDEIDASILNSVDFIIDAGQTNGGLPSTILDVSSEPFKILRKGAVKSSEIFKYHSSIT